MLYIAFGIVWFITLMLVVWAFKLMDTTYKSCK